MMECLIVFLLTNMANVHGMESYSCITNMMLVEHLHGIVGQLIPITSFKMMILGKREKMETPLDAVSQPGKNNNTLQSSS